MYIKDGIAYAGTQEPIIKVSGVRPMEGYKLWIRFNTAETKIVDFTNLIDKPAYAPLADEQVFKSVYIDYGVTVWNNGDIDISPEYLYENGISEEMFGIA